MAQIDFNEIMTFLREMKEENARNINSLRTDIQRLSRDNQMIRDRMIDTKNSDKHSIFNLYRTNEIDLESVIYPYYIIKCQRERVADKEELMHKRYPNATLIYSLKTHNAKILFQVLKERAKNGDIGLNFYKTSFYIDADHKNMTIDDVVTLIRDIERERVEIS